jgi:hypothetical protein
MNINLIAFKPTQFLKLLTDSTIIIYGIFCFCLDVI